MAKKRFLTALLISVLFGVILIASSSPVSAACCVYNNATYYPQGGCEVMIGTGLDQSTCEQYGGNTYHADADCSDIPECDIGCWCGSTDAYGWRNSPYSPREFSYVSDFVDVFALNCNVFCTGTGCTDDLVLTCPDDTVKTIATCDAGTGDITPTPENCGTPIGWTIEGPSAPVDLCMNEALDSDNEETDVDCGGSICDACINGMECIIDTDCKSQNCSEGVCNAKAEGEVITPPPPEERVPSTCGNGVCDTGETQETCVYDCGYCDDGQIHNEECDIGMSNPDSACVEGKCNTDCTCSYSCVENPSEPKLAVTDVKGEKALALSWSLLKTAGCSVSQQLVYRCQAEAPGASCEPGEAIASLSPEALSYKDNKDINNRTTYCYKVSAFYSNEGTEAESRVVCETTGEKECMEGKSFYCENDIRYKCDDRNEKLNRACNTGDACIETGNGNAECVFSNDCDLCNGVFGLFGADGKTLHLTSSGDLQYYPCDSSFIRTCYFDATKTSTNKYQFCKNVRSCYDYRTEEACTADACGAGWSNSAEDNSCEWEESVEAASEFGFGVCRPKSESSQDCSVCDHDNSPARNRFFGMCDYDTCKLYGPCYYSGFTGCSKQENLGCRDYSSEEDCINADGSISRPAEVNVTYSDDERTGNDNAIINPSNDYSGYGTCRWGKDEFGRDSCIKDADGNSQPDCNFYSTNYRACISDNTPPKTTIVDNVPVLDNGRLLVGKDMYINVETDEPAATHFCIVKDDGTGPFCYPGESTACAIQKRFDDSMPGGDYLLYYYSEDKAHNLEKVKSVPVHYDDVFPSIEAQYTKINDRAYKISIKSTNSDVTCSGNLENAIGIPIYPSINIENEKTEQNRAISRSYTNLADDTYYFVYKCWNRAGNKKTGEVEFTVDTDRIKNPQPFGPIKSDVVPISVETTEDAECRYAETTGSDIKYEEMLPFDTTGGTAHSATVYVDAGRFSSFDVKCMFSDGIEGNNNDRIRFAMDNIPPKVVTVSTFKEFQFDDSAAYSTRQTLMLKCVDNHFLEEEGVKRMDAGCRYTEYNYGSDSGNFPGEGPSEPFTVSESNSIRYLAKDNLSNEYSDDINLDIIEPEISIDIFKYPVSANTKKLEKVSYGSYAIRISSTEALADLTVKVSVAANQSFPITASYIESEDFGKIHYYRFNIPQTMPEVTDTAININVTGVSAGLGEVCSLTSAPEEDKIYAFASFEFDTTKPSAKLVPGLDQYKSKKYPLNKVGDIYYTNKDKLFITGTATVPATSSVNFYVWPRGSPIGIQQVYDMSDNVNETEPTFEVTGFIGNKGDDSAANLAAGSIGLDSDYYLEFPSKREDYTNYGEYYGIESIDYARGIVKFDGPLMKDVKESDKITVHTVSHPIDWFGTEISLEQGPNFFLMRPQSSAGLEGIYDKLYTIFYDPYAPEVINQSPKPGVTNDNNAVVMIKIREVMGESQLDPKDVKLYMNGKRYQTQSKTYNDGTSSYYEVWYEGDLEDGTYYVNFTGTDYALNSLKATESASPNWIFTINEDAPEKPIFTVIGGVYHKGAWYVKQSPEFTLYFDEPVDIDFYAKNYIDKYNFLYLDSDCVGKRVGNYYEGCTFKKPLASRKIGDAIEDEHRISVVAKKVFTDTISGPPAPIQLDTVVIDNIPPDIESVSGLDKIRENYEKIFKVRVLDEAHDLNGTIHLTPDNCLTNDVYNLIQVGKEGRDYYFMWKLPMCNRQIDSIKAEEGPKTITLRLADYAGNYQTKEITTFLDLTPPDIEGINVSVLPTRVITLGNYTTKETEIRIAGTFKDPDVTSVVVLPDETVIEGETQPQVANIFGKSFELSMFIEGEFNQTVLNQLTLLVEDDAEYSRSIPLNVVADLQPPYVVSTRVR